MSYNKKTEMWDGYIYLIQNDIHPEMKYIGITITNPMKRWREHISQSKPENHTSTDALHNAMNKYGISHFGMDVIATYSRKTKGELVSFLKYMEIYFVSQFDSYYNGYNATKGGDCLSYQERSVCRFDLDGNYIDEFESVDSIKSALNVSTVSTVYDCCLHIRNCRTAYGYMWRYKDDKTPLPVLTQEDKQNVITRTKIRNNCKIIQYDYTGEIAKIYNSINEVLKDNKDINKDQLLKSLHGEIVYAGIYIYRFDGDELTKYRTYNIKPKVVEKLDLNNNLLQVYRNTSIAAKENNLLRAEISNVCLGKQVSAGGFKWRYPEKYYKKLTA